jgi:uncharacterized protein
MNSKRNLLLFAIVVVFIVLVSFLINQNILKMNLVNFKEADIKGVKIAGQNIKVDLALTNAEREQGLSARVALAENNGMLFVFERSGNYPFWMKNMNFPIDIIWINEDMKVIYIKKDARPESYPETYGPDISEGDAKYVLEVVSGFSGRNNLKEGDKIEFIY